MVFGASTAETITLYDVVPAVTGPGNVPNSGTIDGSSSGNSSSTTFSSPSSAPELVLVPIERCSLRLIVEAQTKYRHPNRIRSSAQPAATPSYEPDSGSPTLTHSMPRRQVIGVLSLGAFIIAIEKFALDVQRGRQAVPATSSLMHTVRQLSTQFRAIDAAIYYAYAVRLSSNPPSCVAGHFESQIGQNHQRQTTATREFSCFGFLLQFAVQLIAQSKLESAESLLSRLLAYVQCNSSNHTAAALTTDSTLTIIRETIRDAPRVDTASPTSISSSASSSSSSSVSFSTASSSTSWSSSSDTSSSASAWSIGSPAMVTSLGGCIRGPRRRRPRLLENREFLAGKLLILMSVVRRTQKRYDDAKTLLQQARYELQHIDDVVAQGQLFFHQGAIYQQLFNANADKRHENFLLANVELQEARRLFAHAKESNPNMDHTDKVVGSISRLVQLQTSSLLDRSVRDQRAKSCQEMLQEAYMNLRDLNLPVRHQCHLMLAYADFHISRDEFNRAEEYALRARDLAVVNQFDNEIGYSGQRFATIAKQQGSIQLQQQLTREPSLSSTPSTPSSPLSTPSSPLAWPIIPDSGCSSDSSQMEPSLLGSQSPTSAPPHLLLSSDDVSPLSPSAETSAPTNQVETLCPPIFMNSIVSSDHRLVAMRVLTTSVPGLGENTNATSPHACFELRAWPATEGGCPDASDASSVGVSAATADSDAVWVDQIIACIQPAGSTSGNATGSRTGTGT